MQNEQVRQDVRAEAAPSDVLPVSVVNQVGPCNAVSVDSSDADKRNSADYATPAMPAPRGETTDTENAGA